MSHHVLVPTDFSETCHNAINHGAEIARVLKGDLLILHVINKDTRATLARMNKEPEHVNTSLRELADSVRDRYGIKVDILSRHGSIFKMIKQVGIERGNTIMVMGTHGKIGFQHLVGSAAIKVVLGMEIPVIVVQKRIFGEGLKKIVLPLSLDIYFMDKLDWVVELAGMFNSEILIFQKDTSDIKMQSAMSKIKHLIISKLHMENIPFQVKVSGKRENFSKQLLDFSIINRADMIIVTMEKNKFDTLPRSGTDEELLIYNSAQIPVMCINPV